MIRKLTLKPILHLLHPLFPYTSSTSEWYILQTLFLPNAKCHITGRNKLGSSLYSRSRNLNLWNNSNDRDR